MPDIIPFPIEKSRDHITAQDKRSKQMKEQHVLTALQAALYDSEIPVGLIRHKKRTPVWNHQRGQTKSKVAEAIAL